MAQSQELLVLDDPDRKSKRETSTPHVEHQHIKTDDQDENEQEPVIMQQPMEMMVLLQQLLDKQDLLLGENKQLKQDMATQQITVNSLSQAIETMQRTKTLCQNTLPNERPPTTLNSQARTSSNTDTEASLKEKAARQLQSKRINQLLESTPFSGTTSQEVSDWIEDFNSKCDQVQLDDNQRLSVAIDLLKGNAKLWYEMHKDTIDHWGTFKEKLMAYFKLVTGTDHFQLEQKLYNRRRQPNELAIDYCHNVLKLCSKVNKNMDDEIRLKHLIKGLNPSAQLHMDSKSPGTIEEFLETLIKFDKWQEEEKSQQRATAFRGHRTNTSQQSYNYSSQRPYHYPSQQHEPHYPPQPHQSHHSSHGSTQTRHTNNEKTYSGCWSCGGMNHYRNECPKNC